MKWTKRIDEVMQDFAQGDILILQNEISNIDYIIEVAKAKQMKIYLASLHQYKLCPLHN